MHANWTHAALCARSAPTTGASARRTAVSHRSDTTRLSSSSPRIRERCANACVDVSGRCKHCRRQTFAYLGSRSRAARSAAELCWRGSVARGSASTLTRSSRLRNSGSAAEPAPRPPPWDSRSAAGIQRRRRSSAQNRGHGAGPVPCWTAGAEQDVAGKAVSRHRDHAPWRPVHGTLSPAAFPSASWSVRGVRRAAAARAARTESAMDLESSFSSA